MSDDERDDLALIHAHQQGDNEAFGVLFSRHRDRLWAVAVRTTGNAEDAADALQEGLIKAFRGAETFRGDSQVTTWLHRIVVNAALDRLRRNKVRAADPLPDDLEEYAARGALATDPSSPAGPEQAALAGDTRARVLAALGTLPDEQRDALVLVDMEGYSVAETAEILDCAVGTVKSRCSRGRAALAPLLRDLGDLGELSGQGTHDPPDASDSQGPVHRPVDRAGPGGERP